MVDGVRANHLLQRAGINLTLPIRGSLGIGIAGEWFDRRTYFKDAANTRQRFHYPQLRGFLAWRLQ